MKDSLIQAGLTSAQADAYLLLLDKGALSPPIIAASLGLTRSNAYKVLEQLMAFGLALREEKRKKIVYKPGDPTALNDLLAKERNRVIAIEKAVAASLFELSSKYQKQSGPIEVKSYKGTLKVRQQYERQASLGQPVYFVRSRSDIAVMGHDFMREMRRLPM